MLSTSEINKLSRLCRIKLHEHEIEDFLKKLQGVISFIDQLQDVDTNGVEPLTGVEIAELRLRQDKVTDGGIEDKLFANVPGDNASLAKEIKCFIVPKMVE